MSNFNNVFRFLPRRFNQWYAESFGYFWLPCSECGYIFGGHEWLLWSKHESSIPDYEKRGTSHGICPNCTRSGVGDRAFVEYMKSLRGDL